MSSNVNILFKYKMFKLSTILKTIKSPTTALQLGQEIKQDSNFVKTTKNWYEERTDKLIVQRNILVVSSILLIILIMVSVGSIVFIVNAREFSPFVIQVDNNTGRATIVNPISSSMLEGNEALAKYFIKKYLIARETYNPVDFDTEARKTIRLLSSSAIYYNYLGYIKDKEIDPVVKYSQGNTTYLTIKSWSKLEENKYIVRFSITETAGSKNVFNKISVVSFAYIPMILTDADRDINPVGFQINGYRVDDDNS
ncbi:virB8 family protein [Candidatus Tisiphia endosymbiont of Nemotelus uliginosus]|uniref:virB8 family protein n=1 Tax=Candidatus Tisiphia endosymbiont of Nemotelus uliginosus TaxID=3077926 RepID=UPI0035C8EBFE